jgi:hypothetical protein
MMYANESSWSAIDATESVLARYGAVQMDRSRRAEDVCLSVVHHYDFACSNPKSVQELNLETLWKHQDGDHGLLLGRRHA